VNMLQERDRMLIRLDSVVLLQARIIIVDLFVLIWEIRNFRNITQDMIRL
jgi:hypothetical protein